MSSWLWVNISLGLLFFGCWAGIPLWLTLTRWKDEIEARHVEVAAWHAELGQRAAAQVVIAQPRPAGDLADLGSTVYEEAAAGLSR